jgi:hypothetical protein
MDPDGDAVVAYQLSENSNSLYAVRLSKSGVVGRTVLARTTNFVGVPSSPAVSMDARGGFFVAWVEDSQLPQNVHALAVRGRAFNASSAPRADTFTAVSRRLTVDPLAEPPDDDYSFREVDIATRPDGATAILAFTEYFHSGGGMQHVRFGRLSSSGLSGAMRIVQSPQSARTPAIAMYPNGSFVIADFEYVHGGFNNQDAFAHRYDAAGSAQGGRTTVAAVDGNASIQSLDVAAMPDGGFIAGYQLWNGDVAANVPRHSIFARRFNASGAAESGPTEITSPFSADDHFLSPMGIGADNTGTAVIAYETSDLRRVDNALRFRRLTTAPLALVRDSVLYAFGTAEDDAISVRRDSANVVATRGTTSRAFPAAQVTSIWIDGLAGDDNIANATALPSELYGGDGNDSIQGGAGADTLHGGRDEDLIWGRGGDDFIRGAAGNDRISGDADNDRIYGNVGYDELDGGDGRDRLFGNEDNDVLNGNAGDDILDGGTGRDRMVGRAGNDSFHAQDGFADSVDGGDGVDAILDRDSGTLDQVVT